MYKKIIDLDNEVFASAGYIDKAIKIDGENKNKEMALSQVNMILVSLKIAMVNFGISYLNIVVSFV